MSARHDKNYKKKTVGELSIEQLKAQSEKRVWELALARAEEEFVPNLMEVIDRGKKMFDNRDFFISNAGKNEQILSNVKREYWIPLNACPTPNFNQIVFRYKHKEEQLEEIWVIPPEDGCEYMARNKHLVVPEEQSLLAYIMAFADGSLDRMCRFLNGETENTPSVILEVQKETPQIITGE